MKKKIKKRKKKDLASSTLTIESGGWMEETIKNQTVSAGAISLSFFFEISQ